MADAPPEHGCDLCGDVTARMFLRARCHPTAPLLAETEGDVLTLKCYLPTCGRVVVRFKVRPMPETA